MKKVRSKSVSRWNAIRVLGPAGNIEEIHFLDKYGRLPYKGPQFRRKFEPSGGEDNAGRPPGNDRPDLIVPLINHPPPPAVCSTPEYEPDSFGFPITESGNDALNEEFFFLDDMMSAPSGMDSPTADDMMF
jgi:hypothetical protein